jgi:hypothetical protein
MRYTRLAQGGPKVTYICCSAKKKGVTCSILFLFLFFIDFFLPRFFGRFVTRGVQKHRGNKNSKKLFFEKNPSGLITKNVAFFPSGFFFSPSVVWFDFLFIAFLGVA